MYFTDREKCAIHFVLAHMALADGRVDEKETAFGLAVAIKLQISSELIKKTETMDVSEALNIIAAMTTEEKRLVCGLMGAMMIIDEDPSPREQLLWSLISTRCGFPNMNISEAAQIGSNFLG